MGLKAKQIHNGFQLRGEKLQNACLLVQRYHYSRWTCQGLFKIKYFYSALVRQGVAAVRITEDLPRNRMIVTRTGRPIRCALERRITVGRLITSQPIRPEHALSESFVGELPGRCRGTRCQIFTPPITCFGGHLRDPRAYHEIRRRWPRDTSRTLTSCPPDSESYRIRFPEHPQTAPRRWFVPEGRCTEEAEKAAFHEPTLRAAGRFASSHCPPVWR